MASQQPLKGVNLGGWLVLEPWMTPSLFAGTGAVDEYTYCHNATAAQKRALKRFRDSFITEQDFMWLAQQGIEAVRLPVGYWLFGQQGSFIKTCQYVDMVFAWAEQYDIQVLLSLHGAPGSQNGKMHSGRSGAALWADEAHQAATIAVLTKIARRYGSQPTLLGISFLNEPSKSLAVEVYESFYRRAQAAMQPHCRPGTWFVMSDNFTPRRWRHRLPAMHLDYHQYQIFMPLDKRLPPRLQLLRARWLLPYKLWRMARGHRLVIGEWSAVQSKPLNDDQVRAYLALQQRAFSKHTDAWFYWSYKTERGGLWSFRGCVERGLIKL